MPKCEQCGKDFKTEHAVRVHAGIQHSGKARRGRKGKRKAGRQFVCPDCGRGFGMSLHLARHQAASHPGMKRGKGQLAAASVVDLGALTIDQLLSLRSGIDSRLVGIARLMRQARIRI